jgi:hypothetical protein
MNNIIKNSFDTHYSKVIRTHLLAALAINEDLVGVDGLVGVGIDDDCRAVPGDGILAVVQGICWEGR